MDNSFGERGAFALKCALRMNSTVRNVSFPGMMPFLFILLVQFFQKQFVFNYCWNTCESHIWFICWYIVLCWFVFFKFHVLITSIIVKTWTLVKRERGCWEKRLEWLHLLHSWNWVIDQSFSLFFPKLTPKSNAIGDKGVASLASELKTNSTLTSLNLELLRFFFEWNHFHKCKKHDWRFGSQLACFSTRSQFNTHFTQFDVQCYYCHDFCFIYWLGTTLELRVVLCWVWCWKRIQLSLHCIWVDILICGITNNDNQLLRQLHWWFRSILVCISTWR